MNITSNYSLTKLFISKIITISINHQKTFNIEVKKIKDFFEDDKWNGVYHLWCNSTKEWKKILNIELSSSFEYISLIIFELGKYKQYSNISLSFHKYIQEIIPGIEFDYRHKQMVVNGITITTEIWDYVIYLLKLTCGEKIPQPQIFNSPEEREFFLKQQEMEERIKAIKEKNKSNSQDSLIKSLLRITYSFPSLTFDYLFDQTMAQIHWLQEMAVGEVSYDLHAQAAAAGNVKKGSKLEFFIK